MKFVTALTFVIAAVLAAGCDSMNKTASAPPSDVLNVAPMPSATPVAAPAPLTVQPPISDNQPVAFTQTAPADASAAASAKGSTYTVKKGDTLFSIAKNQLGTGRDWQKIVAVNPGLSPQKLRVGQQIVMPS